MNCRRNLSRLFFVVVSLALPISTAWCGQAEKATAARKNVPDPKWQDAAAFIVWELYQAQDIESVCMDIQSKAPQQLAPFPRAVAPGLAPLCRDSTKRREQIEKIARAFKDVEFSEQLIDRYKAASETGKALDDVRRAAALQRAVSNLRKALEMVINRK